MSVELALINIARKAAEVGFDLVSKNLDKDKKHSSELLSFIKTQKDHTADEKEKTVIVKKSEKIIKDTKENIQEATNNLKELIKTYGIRDTGPSYAYSLGNNRKKRRAKPKKKKNNG